MQFIKLLFGPRKYIRSKIQLAIQKHDQQRNLSDFEIPINQVSESDVFIVGYPKSGNTWMQSIISGLFYGIDTKYLPQKLAHEIVPDVHARKYYKRFGQINFFKSHHLPKKEYKKVIYIVRDGRDAMVSYYHYYKNLGIDITLEDMIKNGRGLFLSPWNEHVQKWIQNPYNSEIIYLKYEDLLKEPYKQVGKLCGFLNIHRDEKLIERVVDGNKFELMQEKSDKFGGLDNDKWAGEKGKTFFNYGTSGNYKKDMSTELIDFFNKQAKNELVHFGYLL